MGTYFYTGHSNTLQTPPCPGPNKTLIPTCFWIHLKSLHLLLSSWRRWPVLWHPRKRVLGVELDNCSLWLRSCFKCDFFLMTWIQCIPLMLYFDYHSGKFLNANLLHNKPRNLLLLTLPPKEAKVSLSNQHRHSKKDHKNTWYKLFLLTFEDSQSQAVTQKVALTGIKYVFTILKATKQQNRALV